MNRRIQFLIVVISIVIGCSCASNEHRDEPIARHQTFQRQAAGFVYKLQQQGKLPGVPKHGDIDVEIHATEPLLDSQGKLLQHAVNFPVVYDVLVTDEKSSELRYKIVKADKRSSWQLEGAWQKAANGSWVSLK